MNPEGLAPRKYDPIAWVRLEDQRKRRTRRGGGRPRAPIPQDRVAHGAQLVVAANESVQRVQATRAEQGIDPRRLLVVKLTFLADDLLETLAKIGAFIVEERAEHRRHGQPNVYRVVVQFVAQESLTRFLNELQAYRDRLVFLSETPGWLTHHLRAHLAVGRDDLGQAYHVPYVYQFPQANQIQSFEQLMGTPRFRALFSPVQSDAYLSLAERRDLGHSLQAVESLGPEDRTGGGLREKGVPEAEPFYLDVDLWHPGSHEGANAVLDTLETTVRQNGGAVTDRQRTRSMLLARVQSNKRLLDALLRLDIVSRVDLKPSVPEDTYDILQPMPLPLAIPEPPDDGPVAAIVDSGVVPGHELLAGWVIEAVDFASGDGSPVDLNGHGTQVAGVVVYGDIAECIRSGRWAPRVKVLSGKVLNRDKEFADLSRAETQIRQTIEYFVREYDCRVFNLSLANVYSAFDGAHQLPWAHLLDELALEHKLVIVVSSGNVSNPEIPNAATLEGFRREVLNQLYTEEHRLLDPATASLGLAVGSIARRDDPAPLQAGLEGDRPRVSGSGRGFPSPFTRSGFDFGQPGTGISRQVKPDLVGYGGNYCLEQGGTRWIRQDRNLGEPCLRLDTTGGRFVTAVCGTSIASPQVTHVAAIVEHRLRQRGTPTNHRANTVRALLVHGSHLDEDVEAWIAEGASPAEAERRVFRVVGYGMTDPDRASYSEDSRALLVATDSLPPDLVHLYELTVPRSFIVERGRRRLRLTLAYDPPTRATRKEYLARSMWFQVARGLTSQDVLEYMTQAELAGEQPRIPDKNLLKPRPTYTTLQWSTVQSAIFDTTQGTAFNYPIDGNEVTLYVLVGCRLRFLTTNDDDEPPQDYTLVASLEHTAQGISLHQEVNQRMVDRVRLRRRG